MFTFYMAILTNVNLVVILVLGTSSGGETFSSHSHFVWANPPKHGVTGNPLTVDVRTKAALTTRQLAIARETKDVEPLVFWNTRRRFARILSC